MIEVPDTAGSYQILYLCVVVRVTVLLGPMHSGFEANDVAACYTSFQLKRCFALLELQLICRTRAVSRYPRPGRKKEEHNLDSISCFVASFPKATPSFTRPQATPSFSLFHTSLATPSFTRPQATPSVSHVPRPLPAFCCFMFFIVSHDTTKSREWPGMRL